MSPLPSFWGPVDTDLRDGARLVDTLEAVGDGGYIL